MENEVKEPDVTYGGPYSYADYLTWTIQERFEIIKGKLFKMSPAPKRFHQKASGIIFNKIYNFLYGHKCEVYEAPFDVRLPLKSKKNDKIFTVVQPDICVICDKEKLDDLGCIGAPDIVIEILSKGNSKKELQNKYEVYEESGVKEYWIVNIENESFMVYTLVNGKYQPSKLLTRGDFIRTEILPGFELDLDEVFEILDE
ncbi:MAG: Uma2 family endonuclease [Bacteroidia bacterium]